MAAVGVVRWSESLRRQCLNVIHGTLSIYQYCIAIGRRVLCNTPVDNNKLGSFSACRGWADSSLPLLRGRQGTWHAQGTPTATFLLPVNLEPRL